MDNVGDRTSSLQAGVQTPNVQFELNKALTGFLSTYTVKVFHTPDGDLNPLGGAIQLAPFRGFITCFIHQFPRPLE